MPSPRFSKPPRPGGNPKTVQRRAAAEALLAADMDRIRTARPAAPAEPDEEPARSGPVTGSAGIPANTPPLGVHDEAAQRDAKVRQCRLHLADLVRAHGAHRLTIGNAARSQEPA